MKRNERERNKMRYACASTKYFSWLFFLSIAKAIQAVVIPYLYFFAFFNWFPCLQALPNPLSLTYHTQINLYKMSV